MGEGHTNLRNVKPWMKNIILFSPLLAKALVWTMIPASVVYCMLADGVREGWEGAKYDISYTLGLIESVRSEE